MANLTPEQAQAQALKAITDIDDVEAKNAKLRAGVYPELEVRSIRAGIDGKFKTPYYAFEFIVLKNDGQPMASPVGDVAAYIVNLSGGFLEVRKRVLKSLINACAGRDVPGAEYPDIIMQGLLDGCVISAICTDQMSTTGNAFVKIEPAHVRRKRTPTQNIQAGDQVVADALKAYNL